MKKRFCENCDYEWPYDWCSRDAIINYYNDTAKGLTDKSANENGDCPYWRDKDEPN